MSADSHYTCRLLQFYDIYHKTDVWSMTDSTRAVTGSGCALSPSQCPRTFHRLTRHVISRPGTGSVRCGGTGFTLSIRNLNESTNLWCNLRYWHILDAEVAGDAKLFVEWAGMAYCNWFDTHSSSVWVVCFPLICPCNAMSISPRIRAILLDARISNDCQAQKGSILERPQLTATNRILRRGSPDWYAIRV
jgi:hypothetical protein